MGERSRTSPPPRPPSADRPEAKRPFTRKMEQGMGKDTEPFRRTTGVPAAAGLRGPLSVGVVDVPLEFPGAPPHPRWTGSGAEQLGRAGGSTRRHPRRAGSNPPRSMGRCRRATCLQQDLSLNRTMSHGPRRPSPGSLRGRPASVAGCNAVQERSRSETSAGPFGRRTLRPQWGWSSRRPGRPTGNPASSLGPACA